MRTVPAIRDAAGTRQRRGIDVHHPLIHLLVPCLVGFLDRTDPVTLRAIAGKLCRAFCLGHLVPPTLSIAQRLKRSHAAAVRQGTLRALANELKLHTCAHSGLLLARSLRRIDQVLPWYGTG